MMIPRKTLSAHVQIDQLILDIRKVAAERVVQDGLVEVKAAVDVIMLKRRTSRRHASKPFPLGTTRT